MCDTSRAVALDGVWCGHLVIVIANVAQSRDRFGSIVWIYSLLNIIIDRLGRNLWFPCHTRRKGYGILIYESEPCRLKCFENIQTISDQPKFWDKRLFIYNLHKLTVSAYLDLMLL